MAIQLFLGWIGSTCEKHANQLYEQLDENTSDDVEIVFHPKHISKGHKSFSDWATDVAAPCNAAIWISQKKSINESYASDELTQFLRQNPKNRSRAKFLHHTKSDPQNTLTEHVHYTYSTNKTISISQDFWEWLSEIIRILKMEHNSTPVPFTEQTERIFDFYDDIMNFQKSTLIYIYWISTISPDTLKTELVNLNSNPMHYGFQIIKKLKDVHSLHSTIRVDFTQCIELISSANLFNQSSIKEHRKKNKYGRDTLHTINGGSYDIFCTNVKILIEQSIVPWLNRILRSFQFSEQNHTELITHIEFLKFRLEQLAVRNMQGGDGLTFNTDDTQKYQSHIRRLYKNPQSNVYQIDVEKYLSRLGNDVSQLRFAKLQEIESMYRNLDYLILDLSMAIIFIFEILQIGNNFADYCEFSNDHMNLDIDAYVSEVRDGAKFIDRIVENSNKLIIETIAATQEFTNA